MVYTKKEDRQEIKRAFAMLLSEHGLTLKRFCQVNGYDYSKVYQMLNRYNINHDLMNELIQKLDPTKELTRLGNKPIIMRSICVKKG